MSGAKSQPITILIQQTFGLYFSSVMFLYFIAVIWITMAMGHA
jgi:hypothetical protein